MKNLIKYIPFTLFLLIGKMSFAQSCTCDVLLSPISECCAEISINFNPVCNGSGVNIDRITFDSNNYPPFTGQIVSTTSLSTITATVNATKDEAVFQSSVNLITNASTLPNSQIVGTMCFDNVPNNVVTVDVDMSDPVTGFGCQSVAELPVNCPPPGEWSKIYGDSLDNRPNRVKAFNDGVYVIGNKIVNGDGYATFSKFDITNGTLVWESQLSTPSVYNDFEHVPGTDEFILVGSTEGTPSGDNQSLIVKVEDTFGSIVFKKEYDQSGREEFTRILLHKAPSNPLYPYYVLGRKNPAGGPPSGFDLGVLFNIDDGLNVNWVQEYSFTVELEMYRGMVDLSSGNLLLLGNGSIANEGVLVEVDGFSGSAGPSYYYPDFLDLYDGVELSSGSIAIAGVQFANKEAVVYIVKPNGYSVVMGLIFSDIKEFKEIGLDANNMLYALGPEKNTAPNFHVLHRIKYNELTPSIAVDYTRYLYDNETLFANPHFSVTPKFDRVFYADARTDNPNGFGDMDILVGSFDLDFTADCIEPITQPFLGYSPPLTSITVNNTLRGEPTFTANCQPISLDYACNPFCSVICIADFTWTANCFDVQFTNTSTGPPPLTYAWDFGCDGSVETTLEDPIWTFPKGTHQVCLTTTDATGSSCMTMQTITVDDLNAPIFNCPSNVTIPTDPGLCTAMYTPIISATDDCDQTLTISCTYTGATTGTGPITIFNKGVTTVTCITEDDCGNIATCTFDITVVDNEPPQISCPAAISTSVPACAAGSVVTFNPPTFTDNCPMVTYTCSHQSGDFFPCGTTTVTCTATDMSGNMTHCTFPVTVDCDCGELAGSSVDCGLLDDTYDFTIQLIDNTGSNTSGCTVTVTSPQSGVSITVNSVSNVGALITVTGTASIPAPPIPTTLQLVATMTCICPNGPVTCSFPTNLALPCCKSIFVDSTELCKTTPTISIPLGNCNTLHDVTQVRWYVSDAPCQPLPWIDPPFKIATTCDPLLLAPQYHNGDVCIYAEVDMGSGAGPCRTLQSNVGFIKLCEPISCNVNNQEYCYITGTPITPAPLTASISPSTTNCTYDIQWWDENVSPAVPIPGATGLTYQPPALSYTGPASGCNHDYFYKAVITTPSCGVSECTGRIRLHHNDAPVGTLDMNPLEPMPFCPGEDATLEYTPQCAGSPKMWDWSRSTDNVTYTPLPSNGRQNSLYNTNRLYQDTWIRVTKQNGTCPVDEIDFMIDVYDPLMITNFTATHSPPCDPTNVMMQLDFVPDYLAPSTCDYTISWYRDGVLLSTTVSAVSPVSYTHTGTNLGGNYYAIIQSNCCPGERLKSPVITLDPPMEVALLGPCFRCNTETVSLTGIVLFPPGACTFEWFNNGVLIPWAVTDTLTVHPIMKGSFEFKATCGPDNCMKSATYDLLQCGKNTVSVDEVKQQSAKVFPNPTSGYLEIAFENPIERDLKIEMVDVAGRVALRKNLAQANTTVQLDISDLADGIYFIQAMDEQSIVWREKIIKQ